LYRAYSRYLKNMMIKGEKERMRDAHFYQIKIPMLFFAGTRDPFCDIAKLKEVLGRLDYSRHLVTIDGGNHSFDLPFAALPL